MPVILFLFSVRLIIASISDSPDDASTSTLCISFLMTLHDVFTPLPVFLFVTYPGFDSTLHQRLPSFPFPRSPSPLCSSIYSFFSDSVRNQTVLNVLHPNVIIMYLFSASSSFKFLVLDFPYPIETNFFFFLKTFLAFFLCTTAL
jgi:hypothetical protein